MKHKVPLINPLDLVPATTTVASATTEQEEVTAGHYLHDVHKCPACQKPMELLTVSRRSNPVKSWVCVADRISLPLKNS